MLAVRGDDGMLYYKMAWLPVRCDARCEVHCEVRCECVPIPATTVASIDDMEVLGEFSFIGTHIVKSIG